MSTLPASKNRTAVWIGAMRPRTLPLALASILMGAGLAAAEGSFDRLVALLCVTTAVLLQILSNLANDSGDSFHGADHSARRGPQRAVQSGQVTASAMRRAIVFTALLAMMSGLALLWFAFKDAAFSLTIVFVLLGAAAIIAAITYTAGKAPYGYAGFGDVMVLIFFGWVGVIGSYFVQTVQLAWPILLPATACGLLAVAVLNVNNIRDMESDRLAGTLSIPVRLGLRRARQYHWALLALATLLSLVFVLLEFRSPWQLLFLLAVPLLYRNGMAISRADDLPALNPWLKQMSLAALAFVALFAIGQVLAVML
ncbi:MAG TPA: 1,4-dihydroxy-2-naphthoate polyprenyltransferase [Promineifilum sp.]|nr:1,4-dihydroxy-2-naphthoate polyprenyltransferase [Promineifilum sp.]